MITSPLRASWFRRTARVAATSALLAWVVSGCAAARRADQPARLQPEPQPPGGHGAAPEWFRDAKFGIYVHWGVLSVPAFGNDWYPRNMHLPGTREHQHQVERFGPLSEFGYHDFVPLFRAERFNAAQWAELFQRAGARFAGMVAEHHDGFSMWASRINPWNAAEMGPRRDLVGELGEAVHGRGMRFVTTFHMARNLQMFADRPAPQNDSSYFPYEERMATSSTDPRLRVLYGNIPPEQFHRNWRGKLFEVIDAYRPDLIYFDGLLGKIPEPYKREFIEYYRGQARQRGQEVVITHKNGELPESVSVPDYEKGRMTEITPEPWLTDETVSTGSWSYVEGLQLKSAPEILHLLIDIVSKNGAMMLNVSPRADGVIPDDQREILLALGDWLASNGEAIYGTRPWQVYGEGPTRLERGGHFLPRVRYQPRDIRYTARGDTVYAITLGRPGAGEELLFTSLARERLRGRAPSRVAVLGSDEPIRWEWRDQGLAVTTPARRMDEMAVVFRIETRPAYSQKLKYRYTPSTNARTTAVPR